MELNIIVMLFAMKKNSKSFLPKLNPSPEVRRSFLIVTGWLCILRNQEAQYFQRME